LDSDSDHENPVDDYAATETIVNNENNDNNEAAETGVSDRDFKCKDTAYYMGQNLLSYLFQPSCNDPFQDHSSLSLLLLFC
jgi:hypothetical protein